MSISPSPAGPSTRPQATIEKLSVQIKLKIFKYVLYLAVQEGDHSESLVRECRSRTSNSMGIQYSMNPAPRNVLPILLTSKAIYPAARDALYWYMATLTVDLTLESAVDFLFTNIACMHCCFFFCLFFFFFFFFLFAPSSSSSSCSSSSFSAGLLGFEDNAVSSDVITCTYYGEV